jgi:ATP-dependent protease ClpP protease subunit
MSDIIKPVIIPGGLDNLSLPDPDLLNQYIDLQNRTIWISDEINLFTLNVIQYITYWNRNDKDLPIEERKPIKLLFYTQGGMLDIYNSVADVIELSKTPVYGINMGVCASAGAFIFCLVISVLCYPMLIFFFIKEV